MRRNFRKEMPALAEIFVFLEEGFPASSKFPAAAYALTLAIEELFTNMVKYGARGTGTVGITLDTSDSAWMVEMEECSVPAFDPTVVAPADTEGPLGERRVGGLGILLVREMVEDFRYDYRNGCNVIRFSKRLEQ